MFTIITGQPRQGKGIQTMREIDRLYRRNYDWYKKTGTTRKIATNIGLSEEYLDGKEDFFIFWDSWNDLLTFQDVDIIWDEISVLLDSYKYEQLTQTQLHWLTHYAKLGNTIYATTQDYSQLARRARLLATDVFNVVKLFGTPTPSPTKPPIKHIYGVYVMYRLLNHRDENALTEPDYRGLMPFPIPSAIENINARWTSMYDTRQIIKPKNSPLEHIERKCLVCNKLHVAHR